MKVARFGFPGVYTADCTPACLILVDDEVTLLHLLPLLLCCECARRPGGVADSASTSALLRKALGRGGLQAAVTAIPTQLVVEHCTKEGDDGSPHEHLGLPQYLLRDVLVYQEGTDRIAEVVAIVGEHVVVAHGEFKLQLPLHKVPELLPCPHRGFAHVDDLGRNSVWGLSDLGLEDAAAVPVLPVKNNDAGVPDALHLPAEQDRR
mmetsp:Transcript_74536/g.230275  ORF Transcript_74536/g.230275 Transcript_74536/m.230275 type:complete len:206 (-) Transcript_74536:10-627(-)